MTEDIERIPFEVDVNRIIEVLAKQIYQTPLALLRENTQNAFDAILMRRHRGDEFEARIDVTISDSEISISDNGIGMTPDDLRQHYWHAGSSGKNNPEARAAGVVGTFGIGAMANFGIADKLILETQSAVTGERTLSSAERATLSATEDCIVLKSIAEEEHPGTAVRAVMEPGTVDVAEATDYLLEFVQLVEVAVYINGQLASQQPLENVLPPPRDKDDLEVGELDGRISGTAKMRVTAAGEVWAKVEELRFDGVPTKGEIVVRQGEGPIRTFRNGFGLAVSSAHSVYGFGGVANISILEPTAGREALTTASMQLLQEAITDLDRLVSLSLGCLPESDLNTPFMRWSLDNGRLDLCGQLKVKVEPADQRRTLGELRREGEERTIRYFAGTDQTMITAMASDESPLVLLAAARPRHRVEQQYLQQYCNAEELTDQPSVLNVKGPRDWTGAEQAIAFRVTTVLASDYFLTTDVVLGDLSHDLPALVDTDCDPPLLILDPQASTFVVIAGLYADDYPMFGSMVKDFVRNVVFPRVADLVPSSTREGAEAFLKSIRRTRDVFEYEADDLQNFDSIWSRYLNGEITMEEATKRSVATAQQSVQVFERQATRNLSEVVTDVPTIEPSTAEPNTDPAPPILRSDAETDAKLMVVPDDEQKVQGYRCFIALSDRTRKDRGEFFLQPHATSVVWGGQKVMFVFEHHSGEFGLYYDLQANHVVAPESGGGPFPTATMILRNRIFIPIPDRLADVFVPGEGEKKRFEVRSDLLYTDSQARKSNPVSP